MREIPLPYYLLLQIQQGNTVVSCHERDFSASGGAWVLWEGNVSELSFLPDREFGRSDGINEEYD